MDLKYATTQQCAGGYCNQAVCTPRPSMMSMHAMIYGILQTLVRNRNQHIFHHLLKFKFEPDIIMVNQFMNHSKHVFLVLLRYQVFSTMLMQFTKLLVLLLFRWRVLIRSLIFHKVTKRFNFTNYVSPIISGVVQHLNSIGLFYHALAILTHKNQTNWWSSPFWTFSPRVYGISNHDVLINHFSTLFLWNFSKISPICE